jgi:hypothetical protein
VVTNEEGSLGVGCEPSTVRASSGNRLLHIFLQCLSPRSMLGDRTRFPAGGPMRIDDFCFPCICI